MTDIVPFGNDDYDLRTLLIDGEPWFVAADVCAALELGNVTRAVGGLDDDEKGLHTVKTPGGDQQLNVISESGLYSLILRSRKPEARPFKRWVTHDVLPALRKTGTYTVPEALPARREREADKPAVLRVEQYRAKRDRELAKQGMYKNWVTGEILPLPGVVQEKDIDRKLDERMDHKERMRNRAANSPNESRGEFNRNAPWQDPMGRG